MKQTILLLSLLVSCTSVPFSASWTQQQIREQISAHYDLLKLDGYSLISNSGIDTIAVRYESGKITGVIGEVTHRYRVLQGDSLAQQSQVFEVQIDSDQLDVFPAKPLPREEPPSIAL